MSKVDELVEQSADRLEDASHRAAERGGVASKLAEPLADDAAFLRKLKPSLIKARIRGEEAADDGGAERRLTAPPPAPKQKQPGSVNPLLVAALALAAGVALAKLIDWRGHAHPRG
jgi:hypothetical protein